LVTKPKPDVLVLPSGARVTLKGIMSIGSDSSHCQIVLNDPSVSPIHAQVEVIQPGTVMLKDLGSTLGTSISGFSMPRGGTPAQLADNTKIAIGKITLIYLKGTPFSPPTPPPLVPATPTKPKTLIPVPPPKVFVPAPPTLQSISSILLPPRTVCSGYAVSVHHSQQKMPISAGRIMIILALCLMGLYLLIALIPLGILALIIGCTFFPVAMLALGLFGYFGKLVLGNDLVQQTSFRVQDPTTKTAVPVVLFSDRGGSIILSENDQVTVCGQMQPNNTLLAEQVELQEQNGVMLSPPATIRGKLPISPQMGLAWLALALLPCIWLWLSSLGR
jgi:hypothetical protein